MGSNSGSIYQCTTTKPQIPGNEDTDFCLLTCVAGEHLSNCLFMTESIKNTLYLPYMFMIRIRSGSSRLVSYTYRVSKHSLYTQKITCLHMLFVPLAVLHIVSISVLLLPKRKKTQQIQLWEVLCLNQWPAKTHLLCQPGPFMYTSTCQDYTEWITA